MHYRDLREFISYLESIDQLVRVDVPISPHLEMTAFCDKVLKENGPAILFNNPDGYKIKVLGNLFGSVDRICYALGLENISQLREFGQLLASIKEPSPPQSIKDMWSKLPLIKNLYTMLPKLTTNAPVHEIIFGKDKVDLSKLPIWTCWGLDVAPLITWGLVVTRGPNKKRQNLGIYRQQVIAKNKLIMRWLSHRGGALDYLEHCQLYGDKPYPVSVVLGCDPATILAGVIPIPDSISEYQFAGLLRGSRTELTKCVLSDLQVPAYAEIVLEGFIYPGETALEGPYGDHTGYYNEQEQFPVFTVETITMRSDPIYHSTYTGKPLDEPAILGVALNEIFVPILQKQFPEIIDFYLPPEGCSYRLAIISIKKQYAGHAKRVMFGVWSYLRQFMYTKFIIVVDEDINIRDWQDVIWAVTTRVDPARDTTMVENTPIDYLDFASPVTGLGSKIGIDATNKIAGETNREWGRPIRHDPNISGRIDEIYATIFNHSTKK